MQNNISNLIDDIFGEPEVKNGLNLFKNLIASFSFIDSLGKMYCNVCLRIKSRTKKVKREGYDLYDRK